MRRGLKGRPRNFQSNPDAPLPRAMKVIFGDCTLRDPVDCQLPVTPCWRAFSPRPA
jgi:hypothetical protein